MTGGGGSICGCRGCFRGKLQAPVMEGVAGGGGHDGAEAATVAEGQEALPAVEGDMLGRQCGWGLWLADAAGRFAR